MKNNWVKTTSLFLACTLAFSAVTGFSLVQPIDSTNPVAATAEKSAAVSSVANVQAAVKLLAEEDAAQPASAAAADDGVLTECGGNCGHSPTIVIPGISQTETFLLDEEGNRMFTADGKPMMSYPPSVDVDALVKTLAWPLARTLITQQDNGFTDVAADVLEDVASCLATGLDTQPVRSVEVVKYPQSVARCSEHDKSYIYSCIPLQTYSSTAGEDHLYFLAFNSFGNNLEVAQELYDMIQLVKRETGHSKVNLCPISLGATITNSLFEFYPQVYDDINKVVFIVPALDGSAIVSDVFKGNLSLGDEMLYKDLFPSLFGGYLPHLINIALRLLPKQVVLDLLDKVLDRLQQSALVNCTVMWSLVPSADYPALAGKFLSDPAHTEVKRQTDIYYQAQLHSRANILKLTQRGIPVFDVVDYNFALYSIAGSYDKINADGVIHLDSTSMGATSGAVNERLPDGYAQQDTYCSNPGEHNHISPDGTVDASTGLLPETTFYFNKQGHEGTARNDVIIKLATELLLGDEIQTVFSAPGRYPQFNNARESKFLINDLRNAKLIDQSTLAPEDAAELQAAIDECDAVINNTVVDYEAFVQANTRLNNIRFKIGVAQPPKDDTLTKLAEIVLKIASEALYKYWGPRGFSDWNLNN